MRASWFDGGQRHLSKRRRDRLVLFQDEKLLRGVAPPAVRMAQMSDELGRRFVQHPWLSRVAWHAVVAQAPDAAVADDLLELQFLDAPANVRAGLIPLKLFDDAAVHVGDVDGAVRRRRDIDRAEERVGGLDELGQRIDVAELRHAFDVDRTQAANDSAGGFAVEVVADDIFRKPIAAEDVVACRSRRVDERSIREPRVVGARKITHENGRTPYRRQPWLELLWKRERAIHDRQLKVGRHAAAAGLEPHLPVVVLRQPPLTAVLAGRLAQNARRRPADAKLVDGAVHPVVEPPGQAALLELDVRQPAEPGREQLLLVRLRRRYSCR